MKTQIEIDFLDDRQLTARQWDEVKHSPNPGTFTAKEVALSGLIGLGLFVGVFACIALAFLYL